MFSISDLAKSRAFGSARYGTEYIGRIAGGSRSTLCLTVEDRANCPCNIDWSGVSLSMNAFLYYEYSAGMMVDISSPSVSGFERLKMTIPLQS